MKRGAEKQLTQDDPEAEGDDINNSNEEANLEFKKANDSALSQRKIRGMPKRLQAPAQQPQATPNPFGAFSTPSQPPSDSSKNNAFSGFSFANPTTASSAFSTKPTATSSFASFGAQKPQEQPKEQPEQNVEKSSSDENAQVYYYASLKGLNKSLIEALRLATDNNPFIDLSTALSSITDEYKKHISSINDKKSQSEKPKEKPLEKSTQSAAKPAPSPAPSTAPTFSMPTVGNFSLKPSASASPSEGQSSGFGFKPTASTEKSNSPFSFPAPSFGSFKPNEKKDDKEEDNKSDKKQSPKPQATNKFASFGQETEKGEPPMEIPPAPKPASAVPKAPAVPSLFNPSNAFEKPATPESSSTPQTNPFSTGQTLGFGAALGEKKSPLQTSPGFSFGQVGSNSESSPSKPALSFSFGSGSSSMPSFPKPAEMDNAPATPPKFTFGGSQNKTNDGEMNKNNESESSNNISADEGNNSTRQQGAGEEDEDDLYEVKARLYKFEENAWKPSGTGPFKIKQNRENNVKRILHRDASTTRPILNFRVHSEMKPEVDNKQFMLTGVEEDGSLRLFRLLIFHGCVSNGINNSNFPDSELEARFRLIASDPVYDSKVKKKLRSVLRSICEENNQNSRYKQLYEDCGSVKPARPARRTPSTLSKLSTSSIPNTMSNLFSLIDELQSPANEIRSRAEKLLQDTLITGHPDDTLSGIVEVAATHQVEHVRSFALVLIRRLAFQRPDQSNPTQELWADILRHDTRQKISSVLINQLGTEQAQTVRNKLADTLAELARDSLSRGQSWNELASALFQCVANDQPFIRESAWRVWSGVPVMLMDMPIDQLKQLFTQGLQDADINVRLTALKAFSSTLIDSDRSTRIQLSPILVIAFELLPPLATAGDFDSLRPALLTFTSLASSHPVLFEAHVNSILNFAGEIAQTDNCPFEVRQPALELLLSLAEVRSSDEDWETTEDLDDTPEEEEPAQVGEEYIDRLSTALGSKAVLPPAFALIPSMISSQNWQERLGGLMAIASIGEGSYKGLHSELAKVMSLLEPAFSDAHPRVRHGACHAIGQLCTDFAEILQENFYDPILKALANLLQDPSSRVQAHASAALVNFFDAPPEVEVFEPYLDGLIERLLHLLASSSKRYVQEQSITTIATIADAAEDKFGKYYSTVMPLLINVLGANLSPEFRMMKGKAMECATLISLAVGRETFLPDANKLAELLAVIQNQVTESDDPQISYLISAWARIAGVMGGDFAPYLPSVMPPLLVAAQIKPELQVADDDEIDKDAHPELEWMRMADQNVGIQTSALEDKNTAMETLVIYATELKEHFGPYAIQALEIALPSLKFYFHDGVREAASHLVPQTAEISKLTNQANEEIIDTTFANVVEAISDEVDPTFLGVLVNCFYKLVSTFGLPNLKEPIAETFTKAIEQQLRDLHEKRTNRIQKFGKHTSGGDVDHEDLEMVLEEEEAENGALDEISACLKILDPQSGLLVGIGTVAQMEIGPEWEDEE
ncbi:ARM repeat-containing protein [Wallemia mellicola]|uniref:ARM repeat-containing protein n=1 Tax=Wallemia mellicola TaxID=1708541 RepID=A0A4T0MBN4_9BASI|nr:ARM repeat-containing protein [Wallemia mellicola]